MRPLRIGSRGSALALVQADTARNALGALGIDARVTVITTEGDRRAPDTAWGEGAFVTAIEEALLRGEVDLAVHSAKDVPTDEDPRLTIAAFLPRESARDVLVVREGEPRARTLDDIPRGVRVGTDSPRRTAFLRAARPDLQFHPLHGNVDTRLRRLDVGETDVLVLAEAGLRRLGRDDRIAVRLDPREVPPAPGQGALAVQVRSDDSEVRSLVAGLDDADTRRAVAAERALLAATGGGCRAPIGALGAVEDGRMDLLGGYARPDGSIRVVGERHSVSPGEDDLAVRALLDDIAGRAAAAALESGSPRVIVTRPAGQAASLILALVDRGLAPLAVPTIAIQPGNGRRLEAAVRGLADVDWVVVTSVNAARALRDAALAAGVELGGAAQRPRWAAVGAATKRELLAMGIEVAIRPTRPAGAALAETIPLEAGDRVLVPRSDIADPVLVDRLTARGAIVEAIVAYRTVEAPVASIPLLQSALAANPAAVVLTSGSTARGLVALAHTIGAAERVTTLLAVCIGEETAGVARELGYRNLVESSDQRPGAMADVAASAVLGAHANR